MKIRPEHYKLLENRFVVYLAGHPEIDIANTNTTMRGRWDLYWKVGGFSNAQEYNYLDDSNIDTAIKAILQSRMEVTKMPKKGPLYPHVPKSKRTPAMPTSEQREKDRQSHLRRTLKLDNTKTGALYKKKPTRYEVKIITWQERDRLHVGIVDKATEQKSYADWWDDDVRQMFEDGFFKGGMPTEHWHGSEKPSREFENSVLSYAEDMGMLSK
jgi:hypothetical protein